MTPLRVLGGIAVRSLLLLVLAEGIAEIFNVAVTDDDGLGTGLTVMFALVCAAGAWGMWDGFHRKPLALCVSWVVIGLLVTVGMTLYSHLRDDEWSWAVLSEDLTSGLGFWSALIFVPAIACGILPAFIRRNEAQSTGDLAGRHR
ncbi:hypothetical protein JK386_06695 [Nocardioides sp. zg-536]|uniref:Uncharacterized protein n=1 Tax=Nocardioides faecalis TaxID=2803858 RepID=A0A938Y842_9ACTN|nr:hypothetical protein [Nocardioides faecalis]MBM9459585.1 hypothetical protein [Nocardioides faecalis]MBS4753636.1 hypothetical protein [Nocardioides faecalis]QVI58111.1 hypothetical protein KG111_13990 [Nocardioides faecalis]